jgi:predicted MPP superfamily phosphohydrolase
LRSIKLPPREFPLTLAGHTHGGQLMLTKNFGFGSPGDVSATGRGFTRRAESKLVVSNGVGNWFPLRINAPAEIIHLTLRRAS